MKLKVLLYLLSSFYCVNYIAANGENHINNNEAANLNSKLVSKVQGYALGI